MLVYENEVHAILTLEQKYIKVSLGEIFFISLFKTCKTDGKKVLENHTDVIKNKREKTVMIWNI